MMRIVNIFVTRSYKVISSLFFCNYSIILKSEIAKRAPEKSDIT